MLRQFLIPTLVFAAMAPAAGWAQSSQAEQGAPQDVSRKIRDQLTEQGFKDVKVVPGSYIVSGKDKDGTPIMMMIGPNSMTMLKGAPTGDAGGGPSIAQSPGNKDIIEQ
jgi:hypothetical protein